MNKAEKEFHLKRRAFAIINNTLEYIPDEFKELSHYDWLVKHADLTEEQFNNTVRGYIDTTGMYFYIGDFETNEKVEEEAHKWKDIIDEEKSVYCGVHKGKIGEQWKPIKKIR